MMIHKKWLPISIVLGTAAIAPQASLAGIEEIIVTANKREQSLNDVGLTIDVFSSEMLKNRRISTLADIAAATPGLTYAPSAGNTPIYTLRGVGFNESTLGVYPAVSVYIDEAPLTFPVLSGLSAFDLERIEVLKGPQGILFGQNSTGGAINYIAAKPTEELSGSASLTYGRFDLTEFEGFVSGAISNNLKSRIAVKARYQDDWQRSPITGQENGDEDQVAVRWLTDWDATENVRISTNINGWKDQSDPQQMQLTAIIPQTPSSAKQPILDATFPDNDARVSDWNPLRAPSLNRELWQGVIRVEADLTDNLMLTSLSSYIDFEQQQVTEFDGTSARSQEYSRGNGDISTFSQEFRLENLNTEKMRWVLGANFEDTEVAEDTHLRYEDNSTGSAATNFIEKGAYRLDVDVKNWAVFGNVDYNLTPDLVLKLGSRYTESETSANICGYDMGDGRINGLFTTLGTIFSGSPVTPLVDGDCFSMNYDFIPGDPFIDTLKEDNLSWRAGLDFNFSEEILLYFNISKGYKAGSYPNIAASTFRQYEPVTQESVLAYETGIKSRFFDNRLAVNAAVFVYEYNDKQIRGKIADPTFGRLDVLRNIPESEITGAEFDINFQATEDLSLGLAATYIDSEITQSPSQPINAFGESADFNGYRMPFTPRWQVSATGNYEWQLSNFTPFMGFAYSFQSESDAVLGGSSLTLPEAALNRAAPGFTQPYVIDEYGILDLYAGVRSPNETWELMLWGKNVSDEYYWTNVVPGSDTIARQAGMPPTYGVTFSYNF
ncbi:MAG: TonB-dependent receptor [Porticoccaceae bacterium]|nr:TonB-dependent receptor [Porticoccaceae bacterium]